MDILTTSDELDRAVVASVSAIVKARPDKGGRRLVEVEASSEDVDQEGDVILQDALLGSAASFIESGCLDIDHLSELGYRLGIANPASYIIGRPLEVKKLSGRRTMVVGEISRALNGRHDPSRNRFDEFWDTLQRNPPVQWFASVYGFPAPDSVVDCSQTICDIGATRYLIKAMDWRSLAFTRRPVNNKLQNPARVITAKAHMVFLAKSMGTPDNPITVRSVADMAAAAARVETPRSADHAAAGTYRKGHVRIGGLEITIENQMGGLRQGIGPDGTPWHVRMPADYGYVKRTEGADGDHVDVYIGPYPDGAEYLPVWIVDQQDDRTGHFDEHKVMLGFPTEADAVRTYDAGFSDGKGPLRRKSVTMMDFASFVAWLSTPATKQPASPIPWGVPEGGMADINAGLDCPTCAVNKAPSLAGYRRHFMECKGQPEFMADICAHATMYWVDQLTHSRGPVRVPGDVHTRTMG